MYTITRLVLIFITTFFCLVFLPTSVSAEDPLNQACSGNASDSSVCQDRSSTNPLTGTDGVLYRVTLIIASISGIIAVTLIMVSGFRYITSGGDSQKIASAKNTLIGAIIGLVVIALAQTIITFVLSRL